MSDETTLATPPAEITAPVEMPVDLDAVVETPAKEEPAKEPDATEVVAEVTSEEPVEDEPKKNIPGSQKLKNRLRLIEADYESERSARAELERRLAELSAPKSPESKPGVDREPTEGDFPNDYFGYEAARSAWAARQAVREEFARLKQSEQETQSQRLRREQIIERKEMYDELATSARERIPDFDKVIASASDVKITNHELVEEIMSSDKSALLQYYLAKNPDKARELNGLQGRELAREVGRLEARVHLPQAKKATEATPPPSAPKGGAAAPFDPETADMNAYAAFRSKQIEADRRR